MPTYSYRCKACGNEFDIQQSFSDDALTVCESCGGELRKLFNSVGIVFKGSGFYRNDSRGSSSSLAAKDSPSSDTSASTPSAPESKPAPASTPAPASAPAAAS
ncbi:FmdB family transcriptional regulator [Flaviflexus sp. JY899]|uniref:FmdB family transcriptional regulator n=1 Tax=Flaviflexus equikiangi TaxID=2758573 RepID=A0ABS2TFD7_9ACTO|nr:FmdB family zinc ribbon protein [Flaviflexus equikiangi]MBM9432482.1 FmdB family transcriptional regulator [Flaviflexus equikiangi]